MISGNIWNIIGRHTDMNLFLEKKKERKINDQKLKEKSMIQGQL